MLSGRLLQKAVAPAWSVFCSLYCESRAVNTITGISDSSAQTYLQSSSKGRSHHRRSEFSGCPFGVLHQGSSVFAIRFCSVLVERILTKSLMG